jgi:lipoprotein signal peptidase
MIRNYGISLGLDIPGLVVINALVLMGLLAWWFQSKNWRLLLIIVGGGLNLWERIKWGYVYDYWKIPFTGIYNNINDWLIVTGVVLYLWQILRKRT